MNIRKPADYVTMFTTLDTLMAAQLPQMELYCEIGRVVSGRAEKGAAVAASEYLKRPIPQPRASLPAICAVCGRFTQPTRKLLKSCGWRCTSAGRKMWRF